MNIWGRTETFRTREHSRCENSVPGGSGKISESWTSLVAVCLRELECCTAIIIIVVAIIIVVPLELDVIFSKGKTKQICWSVSPLCQ